MAKHVKLTELFTFREVALKSVKRKLAPDDSSNPVAKKKVLCLSNGADKRVFDHSTTNVSSVGTAVSGDENNNAMNTEHGRNGGVADNAESVAEQSLFDTLTEPSWRSLLDREFKKGYISKICHFLEEQDRKGVTVFPPRSLVFNAFNLTPFEKIRVVIIGQDPYHNLRQAHGLCFSVPNGEPKPPSLNNIFKELSAEYPDFNIPDHGTLTKWAAQGVFLLNATLTVEAHKANSHSKIGWQRFTDSVIKLISGESERGSVFLLWGGFAHKKESLIDKRKHRIIKVAHPSPLSARFFLGCKCFSATNTALVELGREPIDWTDL